MKILFLSHEFPPFGGGAGRILSLLCEELHRRGIAMTVLTAAPPRDIKQTFPFEVVYFPTFRKKRFTTNVPSMLLYLFQTLLYCLSGKAKGHSLVFSNMSIPAGIAGIVLRRALKIPHVIWYHNTEVTQNRAAGAGFLFRWAYQFIGQRASVNLFVSKSLKELAETYGIIPSMGILPNATRIQCDTRISYKSGNKLFLFAARMEPVKNPMVLLKAIDVLHRTNRLAGLKFVFVGSGTLFSEVQQNILEFKLNGVASLHSVAPFEGMADLYKSAYALILPSIVEGYPTTVIEAGMFGVPTIATHTIGNCDAVLHNETGILVPLDDVEALASAISVLADDPAFRNRLGEKAYLKSKLCTIQNTADVFLEYFS